jgi:DNA-directed RNA polymerase subunit alpha
MEKLEFKALTLPVLSWNKKTLTNTAGELVAQPLEPGFGVTLGNALRRVLLGAVEGSAVTSIIIKGANNEFATLPGVVEDVMQIVLNVKQIVIRNKTGKPGAMKLHVSGPATAKVSNIVADSHLELVNLDHVIAHVAVEGTLDIQFFVESGRGYQTAQWSADALQADERIYIDAMFSPVRKVTYDVEKTRVGGEIDYDKLTVKINTDGAETPVDVTHYAVSVLRTQLEHFLASPEIPFNEISAIAEQPQEQTAAKPTDAGSRNVPVDLLFKPIEELELSVRAHNCLVSAGIKRVIDLVNLSRDEALKIKNFGRKSLEEVEESLKPLGLGFGMNIKEDDVRLAKQDHDDEDDEQD